MTKLIFLAALMSLLVSINYYANPPDGYTGAPLSNEYSCSICHQTNLNSPLGSSEVNGFPLKIIPGKTYDLEVNIKSTDPKAKYSNFQLMIVDGESSTGSFSNPSDYVKFSTYKDRTYAECKPAVKIKNNETSFSFSWKAPNPEDNKLINLYFTTIIANGDASFAGDRVIESKRVGIIGNSLDVNISELKDNICQNDSSGSIKIEVKGGEEPYSYLWSNGKKSEEIQNLKSGDYFVTVTDNNGFKGVGYAKISEPDKMVFASISKIDVTNNNKGSIEIEVAGGTKNYIYKWYKNDTFFSSEKNISNLDAACYKVVVEDNCHSTIDSTICIYEDCATGSIKYRDEIILYPNPSCDYITVSSNNNDYGTIKLADSKGVIVKTVKQKHMKTRIDLTGLARGLYYIIIEYKTHRIVKKLILASLPNQHYYWN